VAERERPSGSDQASGESIGGKIKLEDQAGEESSWKIKVWRDKNRENQVGWIKKRIKLEY
jgi:hypothetical protein